MTLLMKPKRKGSKARGNMNRASTKDTTKANTAKMTML
jgi:ribosomal protein L32